MTHHREADATLGQTRRLTRLYIAALSAVALLSIAGHTLVQHTLRQQLDDATVVNIAGRQRMLSQRLSKAALVVAAELDDGPAHAGPAAALTDLRAMLPVWRHNHVALQQGDTTLGLPEYNSPEIERMFAAVEPAFARMVAGAERLIVVAGEADEADRQTRVRAAAVEILSHEGDFLRGMDRIVYQYNSEAQARVAGLRTTERVLLGMTLCTLLLEGAFVFRPAVAKIRATVEQLRRTGDELRAARDVAESASRAKSQFLANMSHEFRTPLHAILGLLDLLRRAPQAAADRLRQGHLETIHDAAQSLLRLVNDLLDLARIEANKLEIECEALPIAPLARSTAAMFALPAQRKGITLEVVIDTMLPDNLLGDATRLRQVLTNLLANALKFTPRGIVRLEVRAETIDTRQAALRFEVCDTGIGIPQAAQQRIFEVFNQVDGSSRRQHGGAGLGLSISARLVALMGGRLEVRSTPHQGSEFRFTLLLKRAAPEVAQPTDTQSSTVAIAPESRQGPLSILVADDTPAHRLVMYELLTSEGHTVEVVENGQQAIAACTRQQFDLVFMDLQMPELDGLAATREIRRLEQERDRPPTRLVALSADVLPQDRRRCLAAGMDDYLGKPIAAAQLLEVVNRYAARPNSEVATSLADLGPRWAAALDRLQGRRDLLMHLAEMFTAETPDQLRALRVALAAGDWQTLRVTAHRLKGQAGNFDAHALCAAAERLEQASEDRNALAAETLLPELTSATDELTRELNDLLLAKCQA